MGEPRILGFVGNDLELIALCRRRAQQLGRSLKEIDALANLADGHTSHLLCIPPRQKLGPISRYALAFALELKFALVEDPDMLGQVKRRVERAVRSGRSHASNAKAFALIEDLGRQGARKMLANIDPARLSKARSKAAKSRWRKYRKALRDAKKNPAMMRPVQI